MLVGIKVTLIKAPLFYICITPIAAIPTTHLKAALRVGVDCSVKTQIPRWEEGLMTNKPNCFLRSIGLNAS